MAQTFASCFHDPDPAADWEVWYRDTFDRECPPQVDVQGQGLAHGLMELWARYLFEEIGVGGRGGFSSFHFRWRNNRINIAGSWQGATRLREWVFGTQEHSSKGYRLHPCPRDSDRPVCASNTDGRRLRGGSGAFRSRTACAGQQVGRLAGIFGNGAADGRPGHATPRAVPDSAGRLAVRSTATSAPRLSNCPSRNRLSSRWRSISSETAVIW
jgi:hypothetical protein